MTHSDEEIERAAFAAFKETFVGNASAAWKANQSSCRTIGIPAMRAALSSLTTPKAPDSGLIHRSEVVDLLTRLASEHADMAIYGLQESSRNREAMEAAFTRAKHAVAFLNAVVAPTTPKAWTPIGWNGPFRATMGEVVDVVGKFVCRTGYEEAAEIASILNTACQAGAGGESS